MLPQVSAGGVHKSGIADPRLRGGRSDPPAKCAWSRGARRDLDRARRCRPGDERSLSEALMNATETEAVRELRSPLGATAVRTSAPEIVRFLRDNSWLSPVLAQALERRNESDGSVLGVQAVITPATEADVINLAGIAARRRL